ADFGELVGMSGDQVYQRRRVWETFADVQVQYASLKWSHFYIAVTWDDAAECLNWANDNDATIAEMKAWRRLQHGEDVTTAPPEDGDTVPWGGDGASAFGAYGSDGQASVRTEADLELPAVRAPLPTSVEAQRGTRGAVTADAAGPAQGGYAACCTGAPQRPR